MKKIVHNLARAILFVGKGVLPVPQTEMHIYIPLLMSDRWSEVVETKRVECGLISFNSV